MQLLAVLPQRSEAIAGDQVAAADVDIPQQGARPRHLYHARIRHSVAP